VFIRWAASQTVSPSGTATMIPGVPASCSPAVVHSWSSQLREGSHERTTVAGSRAPLDG
jgi:hypothetical protein